MYLGTEIIRDSEAQPRSGLFHAIEIGDDRAFLQTIDERIAEKSGTFAEERKGTKMWDIAFFPLHKGNAVPFTYIFI